MNLLKNFLNYFLILMLIHSPTVMSNSTDDSMDPRSSDEQSAEEKFLDAWSLEELTVIDELLNDETLELAEIKKAYWEILLKTKKSLSEVVYLDLETNETIRDSNSDINEVYDFLNNKLTPLMTSFESSINTKDDIRESLENLRSGRGKTFWQSVKDFFSNETVQTVLTVVGIVSVVILGILGIKSLANSSYEADNRENIKELDDQITSLNGSIENKLRPLNLNRTFRGQPLSGPNNRGENVYKVLKEFYDKNFRSGYSINEKLRKAIEYIRTNPAIKKEMQLEMDSIERQLNTLFQQSNITLQVPTWRSSEASDINNKIMDELQLLKKNVGLIFKNMNSVSQNFRLNVHVDTHTLDTTQICIKQFKNYANKAFTHMYSPRNLHRNSCIRYGSEACTKLGQQINISCLVNTLKNRMRSPSKSFRRCHNVHTIKTGNVRRHRPYARSWMKEAVKKCYSPIPMTK